VTIVTADRSGTGLKDGLDGARRRRSILAAVIGNFVEFYDWTVYAFLAPIFAQQMFPASSKFASLLLAFSIFALGYVARPLGAFLFGAYGDRIGRRASMIAAITLMAICSLLIGITPTHAAVGALAPAIIVVARCLQGLAAGGEAGNAQTYLAELAVEGRRAATASTQQISTGLSTLAALAVSTILTASLSPQSLTDWGWRIPFILGAIIGVVGIYLRLTAAESLHVRAAANRELGYSAVLASHSGALVRTTLICLLPSVAFFSWQIYLPTYIAETTSLPRATALGIVTFGNLVFVLLVRPSAYLSDRVGRRPVMIFFAVSALIWAYPTFVGLPTFLNSFGGALLVAVVGNAIAALVGGSISAVLTEAFPAQIRATGVGLAQSISVVVSGAAFSPVVTALLAQQRYGLIFTLVAGTAIISFLATVVMPETRSRDFSRF
jgi:MHS family alpha-ketoglutarate permease-like MFS transporter